MKHRRADEPAGFRPLEATYSARSLLGLSLLWCGRFCIAGWPLSYVLLVSWPEGAGERLINDVSGFLALGFAVFFPFAILRFSPGTITGNGEPAHERFRTIAGDVVLCEPLRKNSVYVPLRGFGLFVTLVRDGKGAWVTLAESSAWRQDRVSACRVFGGVFALLLWGTVTLGLVLLLFSLLSI